MLKTRIIVATAVSAFAIGLASCGSASASPLTVWGAEVCVPAPAGNGGFQNCTTPVYGGNSARAIVWPGLLTFYCLYVGASFGGGMFADSGCAFLGLALGFLTFHDAPNLTIKIVGGQYKFEGKVAGTTLKVKCTSMQASEPTVESGGPQEGGGAGMIAAASLEYSGCIVEKPEHCEVASPGKSVLTVATKAVLGDFVENSTRTKVENLFKPQSGSVFAELEFLGSECALDKETSVIEGSTLTGGAGEDLISNELTLDALGALGKAGDDDLTEKAVERYLLISEPSSKRFLSDETGLAGEARLTIGKEKQELLLTGEATLLGKVTSTTIEDEAGDKLTAPEGTADLGLDRD
jgi:hypothetical protein